MLIKKIQRTYDRFGARGTTVRYYHRDDPFLDGMAFNGNTKAVCIGPAILIGVLALIVLSAI